MGTLDKKSKEKVVYFTIPQEQAQELAERIAKSPFGTRSDYVRYLIKQDLLQAKGQGPNQIFEDLSRILKKQEGLVDKIEISLKSKGKETKEELPLNQ
jgi:Arc/MetJ-type ribon-helix-helix transcriptional regulator